MTEVTGAIAPFNSIGIAEYSTISNLFYAWGGPLSGYLAGKYTGGRYVRELEEVFADAYGTKHAIATNSATSGLMAAAFAIELQDCDDFLCPAMTMSATAAAPMFTDATPVFGDVNERTYQLDAVGAHRTPEMRAVFLTQLFGLAIDESWWAGFAHERGMKLVIDAAQAPFATCDDVLAGHHADITVFSFNVHKPLQAGEGGMIITNDDDLAFKLRRFVNHAEAFGDHHPGLNLRMPEMCAAIALCQVNRRREIIEGRIAQANYILNMIGHINGLRLPYSHPDCKPVHYVIPFQVKQNRTEFCRELRDEGVPVVEGYSPGPLYRLPAFHQFRGACPIAENLHDHRLFYIENCAYSFTEDQMRGIGKAFAKAAEKWL